MVKIFEGGANLSAERITWDQFIICCNDSQSVNLRFEDLCRQLFWEEFLSDNSSPVYLHSDPNHPGIETTPVYSERLKQNVGFQAKYFYNQADYSQIEQSTNKIIKYYTGKIETVYLYSNKSLTTSSESYKRIEKNLNKAGINLIPITNETILDLLRVKYTKLALYYFESHALTEEWFEKHQEIAELELGDRFNANLNVSTEAEDIISLFLRDNAGCQILNSRKEKMLETAKEKVQDYTYQQHKDYLNKLIKILSDIASVDGISIEDAISWNDRVHNAVQDDLIRLNSVVVESNKELDVLRQVKNTTTEENKKRYGKIGNLVTSRNICMDLIDFADSLFMNKDEISLLRKNILFLRGRAGIGKSHLLASKSHQLISNKQPALLLLGGDYTSTSDIIKQIEDSMREVAVPFEEILDILENIGKLQNYIVPIMIDAINESWKPDLWKNALPRILQKVSELSYVKLIISYRTEYETKFADKNLITRFNVIQYEHRGFERKTIESVREFLNYYKIPFTPEQILSQDITNPLFLTLYCKTYVGDNAELPVLYMRLLNQQNLKINKKIMQVLEVKGYDLEEEILQNVVGAISEHVLASSKKTFLKEEIERLSVWQNIGIVSRPYITKMLQEGVLHSFIRNDGETLYFAYDQMNDIFCAKAAVAKYKTKDELKNYLINDLLKPDNYGQVKYENRSLYVNVCAAYAEKYGEECIDTLETVVNKEDRRELFAEYVKSLQWRNIVYLSLEELLTLCTQYEMHPEDIFPTFINNSIKTAHSLNADTLHEWLMRYSISRRDSIWTTYINGFYEDSDDRIVQLIILLNKGEGFDFVNQKQVELVLTLFSWCLTSSNRWFRDITSKAMVEILKQYFELAETILKKFETVNDPYVAQRLYGVVFGACCKRIDKCEMEYRSLCKYVFDTIFSKDEVYPDILLRDYARLIIDRFIYEFSLNDLEINYDTIVPPYRSEPIPIIEKDYQHIENVGTGVKRILYSMLFEGMGMYGDFGRYVYQAALSDFDTDQVNIFNYSMDYILNELGYGDNEYLEDYDAHLNGNYSRHNVIKVERIGKKYQWITFYNVLARVSDHFDLKDRFNSEPRMIQYQGAWEPYVRDFDPTLNNCFMLLLNAPEFENYKDGMNNAQEELQSQVLDSKEQQRDWITSLDDFFANQIEQLCPKDTQDQAWVVLQRYSQIEHQNNAQLKISEWNLVYAYFITEDNKNKLSSIADRNIDFITSDLNDNPNSYALYNREYPWSKGMNSLEDWCNHKIRVRIGETRTVTQKREIPLFDSQVIERLLRKYSGESSTEENDIDENLEPEIQVQEFTEEEEIIETIDNIMSASMRLLWEEEYDASKEDSINIEMPSIDFLRTMGLKQLEYDGYFFDQNGKLAAFDTTLTNQKVGLVVRKELLEEYLRQKELRLIWIARGAKDIQEKETTFCEWVGLYAYESGHPEGHLYQSNRRYNV